MGDYKEQEKVINSGWISVEDVQKILPIKRSTAQSIVKEVVDEMKLNKEFYFDTRPRLIPSKKVIEKYNIDVNTIRREAKRIRG
ncbi:MAG: hypothetical protein WC343_04400 [Bacilli bacterium]|jgi:predicted nucleic acid-binding OB-fold protein